jgi:hypothetical protein
VIDEEWRDVDGFDDYQVSNYGRVQSTATGRYLSASGVNKRVTLYVDQATGEKYTKLVSRLVAEAFLDDYSEEYEVHYHSSDRSNCHVENLYMSKHKVRGNSRKKRNAQKV